MTRQHSHPYFTQLPTMRNRQDLAFALDRLPSILAEYLHERQQQSQQRRCRLLQQEHQESQSTYPSPPPSPRPSTATVVETTLPGYRGRSLSFSSVTSLSSSSSSTYSSSSSSLFSACSASSPNTFESRRRRRQHRLIEKNIVSTDPLQQQLLQQQSYAPFRLQFRNRAQAMAFLMQLLKTMQISPEEEEQDEQHSEHAQQREQGLVPCYVCGEWYPEQIALYDQETGHFLSVVDGKSWHEQQQPLVAQGGGRGSFTSSSSSSSTWQHWNAELKVRTWLDQVVAAVVGHHPSKVQAGKWQEQQQQQQEEEEEEEEAHGADIKVSEKTTMAMTMTLHKEEVEERQPDRPQWQEETFSRPASYLIPEEILDPSCRSPGFRIKEKVATTSTTPEADATAGATSTAIPSPPASPRSSLQFTFTSERFRTAVQEASQEPSSIKPAPVAKASDLAKETSACLKSEIEQEEKEEVQQTWSKETSRVVEETIRSGDETNNNNPFTVPQPDAALPTWPLQIPAHKVSKRGRGPWSLVRTAWRLTHCALIRPFSKPSKTPSTPWLSCPKET